MRRAAGSTVRAILAAVLSAALVILASPIAEATSPAGGTWDSATVSVPVYSVASGPVWSSAGTWGFTTQVPVSCTFDVTPQCGETWNQPVNSTGTQLYYIFKSYVHCKGDAVGSWRATNSGSANLNTTVSPNIGFGWDSSSFCNSTNTFEEGRVDLCTALSSSSSLTCGTYGKSVYFYAGGDPGYVTSDCSYYSSALLVVASSTGVVSLEFKYSGTLPSSGWQLMSGTAGTLSVLTTVTTTLRNGTTNLFGFDGQTLAVTAGNAYRLRSTSDNACYTDIVATSGGTSISDTGPTLSDGSSCSFLDIPCYLRALFIPSNADVQSWQAQLTSWEGHAPVSLIVSGYTAVGTLAVGFACGVNASLPSWAPGPTCQSGDLGVNNQPYFAGSYTLEGQSLDFITPLGTLMQTGAGHPIYILLTSLVYLGFGVWTWRRIGKSFGSEDDGT